MTVLLCLELLGDRRSAASAAPVLELRVWARVGQLPLPMGALL